MSVAGIDFGNQNLLIAHAGKGGVDVILNESSNRQTATAVSIQGKQRFLGDAGAALARTNIRNTVQGMKLLLGRSFDDEDVQNELKRHAFSAVKMAHGGVGIVLNYDDNDITVPVEHVFAMMLVKAKETSASANNGLNIADAVLAVPHWFTHRQRRAILQACEIAELNCLKVTNESNAIALGYGIFKSARGLFDEKKPTNVMFVDIGYSAMCVSIVSYVTEHMTVLSTVCSPCIAGRLLDDVIVKYLVEEFKKKTGIDVANNKKALIKLYAAAEKAKKTLSPAGVKEVKVSVECLAEDIDLNVMLSRDEFETRAMPLVESMRGVIEKALGEAKLKASDIAECEVIGGSTRINVVKRVLGEALGLDASVFNFGLKTTMNADEAVCRGAALQAAMLSSRMKVKPFKIVDRLATGVVARFTLTGETNTSEVALYNRNDELPHKKRRLVFVNKTSDFDIELAYDNASAAVLPAGENRSIVTYTVKVPENPTAGPIRVTFNIDRNGLLVCQSAQLMTPVEGEAPETSGDVEEESKESESKAIDLVVEVKEVGLTKEDVKASFELEASMAHEDRIITETSDRRNDLESYIYSMRDRISGELREYGTDEEKSQLNATLEATEDWLYNEGFEVSKNEYVRKLADVRVLGDRIEARMTQRAAVGDAVKEFRKQMEICKKFAGDYSEARSHITDEERDAIRAELAKYEKWLATEQDNQAAMPMCVDATLTAAIIADKRKALFAFSNPIMTKPKPAEPVPEPTPAAETPMDEAKGGPSEDAKEAESK